MNGIKILKITVELSSYLELCQQTDAVKDAFVNCLRQCMTKSRDENAKKTLNEFINFVKYIESRRVGDFSFQIMILLNHEENVELFSEIFN